MWAVNQSTPYLGVLLLLLTVGDRNLPASGLQLRGRLAMIVAAADDPAIPYASAQEEEVMSSQSTAIRRNE